MAWRAEAMQCNAMHGISAQPQLQKHSNDAVVALRAVFALQYVRLSAFSWAGFLPDWQP